MPFLILGSGTFYALSYPEPFNCTRNALKFFHYISLLQEHEMQYERLQFKATFPANISIEKFCRFAKIIISFWSAKNLCVHEVRGRCTFFSKLDFSVVLRTAVSTVVPVKSKFEWAFVPSCHVNTWSSTWCTCWNCFAWRARRGGNSVLRLLWLLFWSV